MGRTHRSGRGFAGYPKSSSALEVKRFSPSPFAVRLTGLDVAQAVKNAHEWFEVNSGWAPPDEDELAEWLDDGVCRCPDGCLVKPDGWCEHGLASWWLVLRAMEADG